MAKRVSPPLAGAMSGLRSPSKVMRLERMGCFHASPLSFMRQLTARAVRDDWQFAIADWQVDAQGVGHAVLRAQTVRGHIRWSHFFMICRMSFARTV